MKNKSKAIILAALSLLSSGLPFHKFYLDKPEEAILRIVLWPFGISWFIAVFDLLHLLCMSESEFNYLYNNDPAPVYTMQTTGPDTKTETKKEEKKEETPKE